MIKQKTQKELERIKEVWMMVAVVGWIFFIFTLGVSMYVFETEGHPVDLKQQLSDCQEQVEENLCEGLLLEYSMSDYLTELCQDYIPIRNSVLFFRCDDGTLMNILVDENNQSLYDYEIKKGCEVIQ